MKDRGMNTEEKKGVFAELHDVWVRYNVKWILKSIYLKCYEGEILGIVGPNGGGKSTLLKVILGLVRPEKGSVRLFGRMPDKRGGLEVGYLPQISHADRSFPVTVLDVVLMGLYGRTGFFKRPGRSAKEIAMNMLSRINMADYAKESFGTLSGGQQQRVNVARALVSKPKLLVLDEPSTGIDTVAQEEFYELLAEFRDELGISVIMVSHDIGVITAHADSVACLNTQLHYHGEPDLCFKPEVMEKIYGKNLKVMIHDSRCVTCYKRHEDHD